MGGVRLGGWGVGGGEVHPTLQCGSVKCTLAARRTEKVE